MKKIILVTGAHRSGSTWTGKVISKKKNISYIHEPFNISIDRKNIPFTNWFEYLNNRSKIDQRKASNYLKSFFHPFHIENLNRGLKIRSLKSGLDFLADLKKRITNTPLIKDPIAIMSAEWIYEQFNCDVIITIRHPAAFIASIKVKNWQFDFNNFLRQDGLMKTYLSDYRDIIKEYAEDPKDIIKQGILLWNTIYSTVQYYKEKYPNEWYFVRHEDLSLNPQIEFEKIFDFLNIDLTEDVEKYIIETTTAKEKGNLERDSKKNIQTWKNRLTPDEISLIKKETRSVWINFYTENDW